MKKHLSPSIDDLKLEYVLIQAWKKTTSYIRYHNWYCDILELDYHAINLPGFIDKIQENLKEDTWETELLRIIPAPKSQKWKLESDDVWKQRKGSSISNKIRPLAHVGLKDQVIATAITLCLADKVETLQGNPDLDITTAENRKQIINYGNRLFCDYYNDGGAHHRWGSITYYRKYFSDYQTFLTRPEVVVKEIKAKTESEGREIAIVHSDLSKFYDRVRPKELHAKIKKYFGNDRNQDFIDLISNVIHWNWYDRKWSNNYAQLNKIEEFSEVALPQGLVAAGFFANIFLLDFDDAVRNSFNKNISEYIQLVDACRYVDDLKLVLQVPQGLKEEDIQLNISEWLQEKLNEYAPGQSIEPSKTRVLIDGSETRFLVPLSHNAKRIQHDVSGTFDMLHGTELIGAIEGFFYTQKRYANEQSNSENPGLLVGISDMRDDTASRFAAGKYRKTFRSLRPLLNDEVSEASRDTRRMQKLILSKQQLDERGKLFAAMLIEEWVNNPANVRLLRVALDLYPDKQFLEKILKILKDGWTTRGCVKQKREVKLYCLSELFKAGAIETGQTKDDECLPTGVSLANYHKRLIREGLDILNSTSSKNTLRCPWYLMQQIYLYLFTRDEISKLNIPARSDSKSPLKLYFEFAKYLSGRVEKGIERRSVFTTLAVQSFGYTRVFDYQPLSYAFLEKLASMSLSVANEFVSNVIDKKSFNKIKKTAQQQGLMIKPNTESKASLPELSVRKLNPFWSERNILKLAVEVSSKITNEFINPWQIICEFDKPQVTVEEKLPKLKKISIDRKLKNIPPFIKIPKWANNDEERKRFILGVILRFALRGPIGFFSSWCSNNKYHIRYRSPEPHWLQFYHGGYHGRTAFAPEWVALSSWTENMLFELFRWPGCGFEENVTWEMLQKQLEEHSNAMDKKIMGKSTNLDFLQQQAPYPWERKEDWSRILRVGLIQSVFPYADIFKQNPNDPELNSPNIRKKHKRHIATLMEGVTQMLQVRETHDDVPNQREQAVIDLLIFPELAIHPDDVETLLVPFVRKHRCIVLAGLVYHSQQLGENSQLINSALWIIPDLSASKGLQIKKIEQGKNFLTNEEKKLNPKPVSFRPAQWIISYDWSPQQRRPLYFSGSICYDSTDIKLNADLRSRTDLLAICALNKDVGTFDRLSESNHYQMFQGLIVANNGKYGGSNCYMPFGKPEKRQVLHLHGQPQAQIAFIEIDPEKIINRHLKKEHKNQKPTGEWKTPPAGWEYF